MTSDETKLEQIFKAGKLEAPDAFPIEQTYQQLSIVLGLPDEMAAASWGEMVTREILLSDSEFGFAAAISSFDLPHVLALLGPTSNDL